MDQDKKVVRILGVASSPRAGGNTDILLDRFFAGAREAGAEVERVALRDHRFSGCVECAGCEKQGRCVVSDGMQDIYPLVDRADHMAFASPIFFYGITAQGKAFVDRAQCLWARRFLLKQVPAARVEPRRGIFLSVGATSGEKLFRGACMTMKYYFREAGFEFTDKLLVRGPDKAGEIEKQPEVLASAGALGGRVVRETKWT